MIVENRRGMLVVIGLDGRVLAVGVTTVQCVRLRAALESLRRAAAAFSAATKGSAA